MAGAGNAVMTDSLSQFRHAHKPGPELCTDQSLHRRQWLPRSGLRGGHCHHGRSVLQQHHHRDNQPEEYGHRDVSSKLKEARKRNKNDSNYLQPVVLLTNSKQYEM
jgi:hypothetical protein